MDRSPSFAVNILPIGIRPEYVHLADGPGENVYLCKANRIVEGVSLVNCFFSTDSTGENRHWVEVSLHKMHAPQICEGHDCYVRLPAEHIAVIRG